MDMGERERREFSPEGDPVCWLENVCTECGALVDGPLPATCWRCGAVLAPTESAG